MSFQPPEEDIQNFMAMAPGIDRREVIARIKGNNNNVEYAINEYYDDPTSAGKYQWHDGAFSSDRDGGYMHGNVPCFNIHSPDETGPYAVREPQTRPPSRANNASPMSNMVDLTMDHANADSGTSMALDEDSELERAIAASRVSAGLPPQESGIVNYDGAAKNFGPATRSEYEEKEWGLVAVGKSSVSEIILDPDAALRKRNVDAPAFLKASAEEHCLGALLTIYHEIPLLRELFVNRVDCLSDYGHDSEWWSGKIIEVPIVTGHESHDGQELNHELQRLMAFLDKTDRSYGSTDALSNLRTIRRLKRLDQQKLGKIPDPETIFFQAWRNMFDEIDAEQVSKLFSVGVDCEQRNEVTEFAILDLPQPIQNSGVETFYDITDDALWAGQVDEDISESAYLEHVGEVITFRLRDEFPSSVNVDVPAIWYPDRYMKASRQAALDMRRQKSEVNTAIQTLSRTQDGLTDVCVGGRMLKVKKMLSAALQHDQEGADSTSSDQIDPRSGSTTTVVDGSALDTETDLSNDISKLVASIDQKLLALNQQKEQAQASLRRLSDLYTQESSGNGSRPLHKYALRGVITSKNTSYLCRKAELDLIEMDVDGSPSSATELQWWRIHYTPSGTVSVEKTTENHALKAAKTESKNVMLVYASEKAMRFNSMPLPQPLEAFILNDNHLFQEELSADHDNRSPISPVSSPSKRKFAANSDPEEVRRSGMGNPMGYESSVQVMSRELGPANAPFGAAGVHSESYATTESMDESRTATPGEEAEVIVGIDPTLLDGHEPSLMDQDCLDHRLGSSYSAKIARDIGGAGESMDLDHVIENENVTDESPAVKHVELA